MSSATQRGRDVPSVWTEPELAVARSILVNGPISRTDIAERLGLSQPTLTRLVKPLLAAGLVEEQSESRSEGAGRPSRPLVATAGDHRFVGVKLTGDEAFAVLVDIRADEHAEARLRLDDTKPDTVVDAIESLVAELRSGTDARIEAIGVSIGGSARDGRTVDRAPFLGWHGVDLATILEQRLGIDAAIDNDVIALTAAEHWFGEGRGLHDFGVVTIGAGIGLGLVRRDEVVRTRDAGLGLAGHIPLDAAGPLCMLGHRGCSTALLATPSMLAQHAAATGRSVTYAEFVELGRAGDPSARAILSAAGTGLGKLLSLVANLAFVETIVLSGDGLAMLDVANDEMLQGLAAGRDPDASDLDVRIDSSDFARWARGAGAIAIQHSLPRILRAATERSRS